ncbi:MAG: geranylgeranylglyceryl/heptaprenylglyceryl phosphate synthase [Candidatus Eisenbacteria bacterium]
MRETGRTLAWLEGEIRARGALYLVLLDPDRFDPSENAKLAALAVGAGADALLVGGSLSLKGGCDRTVRAIKGAVDVPVILFPGDIGFVTEEADAILFLSLVSGRNPQFLIGEHVRAAPVLKEAGLEPIPTAYMLVEGGATTSVEFMSSTKPIPRDKPDIAMAHALAAQYLGMRLAFFDAGSGAAQHVPEEMVRMVSRYVDLPVMVGGGIREPAAAGRLVEAGASVIITGDVVEKTGDAGLMKALAEAVHEPRSS